MSTLGRKAMKKTLKRLKKDAFDKTKDYIKTFDELQKDEDELDKEERELLDLIVNLTYPVFSSLLRYIHALQDYSLELDEEWDKLLKSVEARQSKPMQKKEEAKKTKYID